MISLMIPLRDGLGPKVQTNLHPSQAFERHTLTERSAPGMPGNVQGLPSVARLPVPGAR